MIDREKKEEEEPWDDTIEYKLYVLDPRGNRMNDHADVIECCHLSTREYSME